MTARRNWFWAAVHAAFVAAVIVPLLVAAALCEGLERAHPLARWLYRKAYGRT